MSKKSWLIVLGLVVALAIPAILLAVPAATFEGRPTFDAGSASGAFVWHDGNGLHVRFTTKANERYYHGKVCAGKIMQLDGYHVDDDSRNKVEKSEDGKCINIELYNKMTLNGFDFKAKGKKVEFRLKVGSGILKPKNIWIGAGNTHPPASPFTLDR